MKVIKEATKEYHYYVKCTECGSIIEYLMSEVTFGNIICPTCNYNNFVGYNPSRYTPSNIKEEVEEIKKSNRE